MKHKPIPIKLKWLWQGLIEALPLLGGATLSASLEKFMFSKDYLTLGILLSAILIILIKNKAPEAPVGLAQWRF